MRFRPARFLRRLLRLPGAALGSLLGGLATIPAWAVERVRRVVYRRFYEARERGVFLYWSGDAWLTADPMEVWGRLTAEVGSDFAAVLELVARAAPADADPEARDAFERERAAAALRLADAACVAFRVRPVGAAADDEGGLTQLERIKLVVLYLEHLAAGRAAAKEAAWTPS